MLKLANQVVSPLKEQPKISNAKMKKGHGSCPLKLFYVTQQKQKQKMHRTIKHLLILSSILEASLNLSDSK